MAELYNTIRALCDQHGVTVSKMCLDIGVSKSTMSDLKSGRKKTMTAPTLKKIADYLNVSVDNLLGTHVTRARHIAGLHIYENVVPFKNVADVLQDFPDGTYDILLQDDYLIVVKDEDCSLSDTEIQNLVKSQTGRDIISVPDDSAHITDDQLKFALWGDTSSITDADLEDVRRFAAFIKQKREQQEDSK